jgi:hypothetical protein
MVSNLGSKLIVCKLFISAAVNRHMKRFREVRGTGRDWRSLGSKQNLATLFSAREILQEVLTLDINQGWTRDQ